MSNDSLVMGCSSHLCDIARPVGMATNGQCRCDEHDVRRALRAARRRIVDLEAALREALDEYVDSSSHSLDYETIVRLRAVLSPPQEPEPIEFNALAEHFARTGYHAGHEPDCPRRDIEFELARCRCGPGLREVRADLLGVMTARVDRLKRVAQVVAARVAVDRRSPLTLDTPSRIIRR